ncbi:helix-turn-helix domain-containing protein [Serratia marcescens]|uniref:winged helix-turn-helix transcriptional regulator n=1 Tax=Serratia marcescens TaxID=615 RepID=UPI00275D0440|nr:helix-turn-helix domain-containing protein [Serratia marcescens]MDP8601055.1 helix-turn-helix domain-containing protein [Serratia marcescens]MDP8685755.1 helix-turn-helix domain-containing protein [Serratia marcescens]MDP8735337.1 helix-turn-helix domain-containing protein [Serratia marcescens]MDP8794653.1 helix-turn-helix domain-containing protein [Serratia marcescens]HEJ7835082.1 helix-turn-helix transcriptional regulator [Serratia marcescens]
MKKLRNYDKAPGCSMEAALHILGGKWKGVILYHLFKDGTLRFSELQRFLPNINQRLLTKQLRELEEDGLIHREVYPVVPPRVEYSLTDEGRTLYDLIMGLSVWGKRWLEKRGMSTAEDENIIQLKSGN